MLLLLTSAILLLAVLTSAASHMRSQSEQLMHFCVHVYVNIMRMEPAVHYRTHKTPIGI
jgi:hypothetical protein